MRTDTKSDTFVAGSKGHNLGGVHPADGQDTPGEDVEEEEGECYEYPSRLRLVSPRQGNTTESGYDLLGLYRLIS